ncbi:KBTBD11 [Branchiostoma lanceolatum]|uniref:KBTBD11 protein n=1 Tax=Branchiostoma lanceolatum TaxID=7740 RepID=A0A8K0EJG1_BRALA|nr:KBTBD11 [Branchiostoma lanceolatum]
MDLQDENLKPTDNMDFFLLVEDKRIPADRDMLVKSSSYFRAMFSSGMRENCQNFVELHGLSSPSVRALVNLLQTSQLSLKDTDIEDFIATANFLQVQKAIDYVKSHLDAHTCVDVLNIAEIYCIGDLEEAAYSFLVDNYFDVFRKGQYERLREEQQTQVRERRKSIKSYICAIVEYDEASADTPRKTRHLYYHDDKDDVFRPYKTVDCRVPKSSYGAAVLDNNLYIVGGYVDTGGSTDQPVSSGFRFDPMTRQWHEIKPLQQARAAFTLAATDTHLYAIGGKAEVDLFTVERYDPKDDTWTYVAPLPRPVTPEAATACMGDVYVAESAARFMSPGRLLKYCTGQGEWTDLGKIPYRLQCDSDMVSFADFVVLIGSHAIKSYNITSGEWYTMMRPMGGGYTKNRFDHVVYDGDIFFVGRVTTQRCTPSRGVWDCLAGVPGCGYRKAFVLKLKRLLPFPDEVYGGYEAGIRKATNT